MSKKQKIIGGIVLFSIILAVCIYKYIDSKPKHFNNDDIFVEEVIKDAPSENTGANVNKITVEIKGEVNKPGVYFMNKNSILKELISEAGGATERADLWNVNGAELLKNNISYKIPPKVTISTTGGAAIQATINRNTSDGKININTATEKELDYLPGIGKTMAEQIVSYRNSNGPFREVDDLKKVNKRITEKVIDGLKDKVLVN